MFDLMVKEGRMPRAKRVTDRRIAWDVRELDSAVDRLPEVEGPTTDETWSDIDAS
jgi:hypothetical protein